MPFSTFLFIPRNRSWTPPKNVIMQNRVGNPATGSPHMIVLITTYTANIKDRIQNISPSEKEQVSGVVEKANIPSREYVPVSVIVPLVGNLYSL